MATLFSPDGTPVEVADDEVVKRYLAGELGFADDRPVPISSPDGRQVGELPATSPNLRKAFESGWKFDPVAVETRRFGGTREQAKAFAEGAAGVIPGAPAIEAELLGNLPEQQRRARIFPGTKTAGEVAGMVGASVLAPELAAPRGAAAARVVIGGAVEAGLQGGVLELNRQILGEEPIAAEKIISSAGTSALFGGGAAGTLRAAGAITSGVLGKGTRAFRPLAQQGPRSAVDDAIESFTVGAEKDPVGALQTFGDAILGKDRARAAGRLLNDKSYRRLGQTAASDAERANIEIAEGLESMRSQVDKALDDIVKKYRGEIDPALAAMNPTVPRQAAFDFVETVRDRIRFMKQGDGAGRGGPGQFFNARQIADLEKQVARLDEALGIKEIGTGRAIVETQEQAALFGVPVGQTIDFAALPMLQKGQRPWFEILKEETRRVLDPNAVVRASDVFRVLDDSRDALWDIGKLNKLITMAGEKDAADEAIKLAVTARGMLEDVDIFGKAGSAQARKNALLTRARDISTELGRKFGAGVDSEVIGGSKYLPISAEKVKGFFADLGDAAWEPHRKTLGEAMLAWREIGDELLGDAALQARISGTYAKTAAMAKLARAIADVRRLRGIAAAGENALGSVIARAALGSMAGGPIGAVAGVAAPYIGSAVLNLLGQMSRANTQRIAGFAGAIARGARPAKRAAVTSLSVLAGSQFSDQPRKGKPKNAREAYARVAADLRAAMKDPEGTLKVMRANAAPIALEAPEHAEAIVSHGMSKLQYLASKLPPEAPRDPLTAAFHVMPVSDYDIADFAQVVRAVEDPVSVIEDLAHGSMSLIAAETLRETSPAQFAEMKAAVIAAVQESGKPVPYETRIRLSMLFDTPLDPTIDPTFISFAQLTYAPPPPESGAPQGTGRTTKELKSVKNAATAMQEMEAEIAT